MKPKIYKIGPTWILWVPGVRVYRFTSWGKAMQYALESGPTAPIDLP